jgi:predicted TIM-barrel fold metal-dependent hydrolase
MAGASQQAAVLDVHQHHGHVAHSAASTAEATEGVEWLEAERSARVRSMERLGVGRTLILPGNSYLRPRGLADTRAVNDGIAAYCAHDPARYVAGAGVVEPLYGRDGLPELERIREVGLIGVSYHPRFQGVAANDEWILRHLEVMAELGLVPFVHSYGDSTLEAPVLIGELAAARPELTIVVLDGLSSFHHTLECIAVARRYPNLVFDTAMAFNVSAVVQFAAAVGTDRLLFGSDIYSHPIVFATMTTPEALAGAGFAAEDLAAILGGNAERILGPALAARTVHPG